MDMRIKVDDLADGKVIAMLEAHHAEMHLYSPPESVHALDKSKFKDPSLTFWSAWDGEMLIGCGALKQLSDKHGEVKSMRTAKGYLRQGIAEHVLQAIMAEAKQRGYKKLSLETGVNDAFGPSLELYKKHGFEECGPFGCYVLDPHSQFYSVALDG